MEKLITGNTPSADTCIKARIDALGIHSARIIEPQFYQSYSSAGSNWMNAARVEFWIESQNVRLELEPLLNAVEDSYQVDSFSTDNCRHLGSSNVHQSALHTAMYVEALKQIEQGL